MPAIAILLLLSAIIAGPAGAAEQPRRFVVFFQEWSAALDPTAQSVVGEAAGFARSHPRARVSVHGFADPTGGRTANVLMSELRAQRVTDQLQEDGIAAKRIRQNGHGSVKFAITSLESRRVEVEVAP
jgi:outer membrane protein OmpA-like peptidoglycan-associated protein